MQLFNQKYQQILADTQNEVVKLLSSMPNDIKTITKLELGNLGKMMQTEMVKSLENLNTLIGGAYKQVENELENYKSERLRQLDSSIMRIIKAVSRKVLSKEISVEEHEKLVMKSLEEAKRQNVFSEPEIEPTEKQ